MGQSEMDSSSTEIKRKLEDKVPFTLHLTKSRVKQSVKALLKVASEDDKEKKQLFEGDAQPVLLQVVCIKVPETPTRQLRFSLKHSVVSKDDDVALFVRDLGKGRRRPYDDTVEHYEGLLRKHKCDQIKEVIPMNRVKTEFNQFELKRKLLGSFDHFLVDGRISGHLSHVLGKVFFEKRKLPVSVHMDKKDLKAEIDKALKKTAMRMHSKGDTHTIQVGTTAMTPEQVADNVLAVFKQMDKFYPGGIKNVKSLSIKTALSIAIPVYLTTKSKNDVEVPVVLPKRPKAAQDVEGELSTLGKNSTVKVTPEGNVYVLQDVKKEEAGSEESESDDENFTMEDSEAEVKDEIKEESDDGDSESEEES